MKTTADELQKQMEALARKPTDLNASDEAAALAALVSETLAVALEDYEEPKIEGIGGSGVVLSAVFKPFSTRRAVKIPRARLTKEARAARAANAVTAVDPELHALSKLSHEYITRLYSSHEIEDLGIYCAVTEYVTDPRSLSAYAADACCTSECRDNLHTRNVALRELARVIQRLAQAFAYMHDSANLIHFDIKPDNLLVSAQGAPYVTDLGFARDTTKYRADEEVKIGFTWKYAHPELTDPDHGARISETPVKSKNRILGAQLSPRYDLFAFGRTIQEVLKELVDQHGDAIYSDYVFNYLHLIACLCLDGRNATPDPARPSKSFVADTALGSPAKLFKAHAFTSFQDVLVALQRLLGQRRLEDDVPELDSWAAATINVSDLGATTLTPRVASVLNHPVFYRLADEAQLGMLETVFPTASHSRLEHCLGVYHAIGGYISALYYDPENPMFRALFDTAKCTRLLLAALVHDLGQTAFGHELEEVDPKEFKHEEIGAEILRSCRSNDATGRTLREIVEQPAFDCWDTPLESLQRMWSKSPTVPFDWVLHDILDGQLDADKLDYLIRDSVECRVPYGEGIDHRRLLRSLTTRATNGSLGAKLRLAVKQKGAASAEAFAFARYQLYQSMYWHHTFRAVKAMFLSAAAGAIEGLRHDAAPELDTYSFRAAYIKHVHGLDLNGTIVGSPADAIRKRAKDAKPLTLTVAIARALESDTQPTIDGKYSHDRTLVFLWKLAKEKDRRLLEDIMTRRYYKRVFEIPMSAIPEAAWIKLRDRFSTSAARLKAEADVDRVLQNLVRTAIQDQSKERESLVIDRSLDKLGETSSYRKLFLLDLPLRGWYASGDEPMFVSDYKRRHFRSSEIGGPTDGGLWSTQVAGMMKRIAVLRVFCEPDAHRIVTRVVSAEAVAHAIREAIPELG